MTYFDGYLVPVPTANKDAYIAVAKTMSAVFRAHGALRVVDTWSDDVPKGTMTDFWKAVAAKPDEAVVFSWIEWPSKEARNTGMKAAMGDPRMPAGKTMPYDGKRLIFGGFSPISDTSA